MASVLAVLIFSLGYLFISLEAKTHVNKSGLALAMGGLLWVVAAAVVGHSIEAEILHSGAEIFGIVVFLLAAMSLVEILAHYRFFDVIRNRIFAHQLTERQQFLIIATVAFFLSGIIDNLTTTIVMVQIARKFFRGNNLLVAAVGIVIAANAGGAFSPIGDVTTIMLWLAEKFTAFEIITMGFLPSLALFLVAAALLVRHVKKDELAEQTPTIPSTKFSRGEKLVIALTLGSFALPLVANAFGLPPYMGLLLGLGLVWMAIDMIKNISTHQTHLTASIEQLIQKTDISSIKFFIGILLAVSALNSLGLLEQLSTLLFGEVASTNRVILGSTLLGLFSAVLDNVPLTAIAINILDISAPALWVLLALAVGTGGSLLVVGSAAGVIAMGMIKELTFAKYFKIGFIPAALSFAVAIGVWGLQSMLLGII